MTHTTLLLVSLLAVLNAPIAPAPVRVATLLPFVADALDRLPGEVEVVASVPAELGEALPPGRVDLGNSHSPSFELLAASRPDLVVGNRNIHSALASKLERFAPTVLMIEATSVDQTLAGLAIVGEAASVSTEMDELIASTRQQLASLRLEESVSILPLFGAPGTYMAITERTWLGDLIDQLGFDNLAAGLSGRETYPGYVEISEEVLASLDPDIVALVTHGSPSAVVASLEREAERGGAWARLASNIEILEPSLFARNPGLGMAEAGRTLVDLVQISVSK